MDPDISLRRIERSAVVLWLAMAAAALVLPRGGAYASAAVLGGGLLAFVSYWSIKRSVSRLIELAAPASPAPRGRTSFVLKLTGRYALLVFLAYVMIARLRLHPFGLLVGASSVVAAVFIEAIRLQVKKS